jgi:hypothetical protein
MLNRLCLIFSCGIILDIPILLLQRYNILYTGVDMCKKYDTSWWNMGRRCIEYKYGYNFIQDYNSFFSVSVMPLELLFIFAHLLNLFLTSIIVFRQLYSTQTIVDHS